MDKPEWNQPRDKATSNGSVLVDRLVRPSPCISRIGSARTTERCPKHLPPRCISNRRNADHCARAEAAPCLGDDESPALSIEMSIQSIYVCLVPSSRSGLYRGSHGPACTNTLD